MDQTHLVENSFGHGGLGHFLKPTDWHYGNIAPRGTLPFDWNAGYDAEVELAKVLGVSSFKIPVKNQGQSGSCGGQAGSYYDEVLNAFQTKTFTIQRSAKFIYSQIFAPGGGSFGGDIMDLIKNQGVCDETYVPSYENGLPPSEEFMERLGDISDNARAAAKTAHSKNYSFILNFDIDVLAQAVRDNKGIIIAIFGQNNGTWLTQFPVHPTDSIGSMKLWGHWLYVGKAIMVAGKKYLVVLNSWGDKVGLGGWQFISEEYVNSGYLQLGMNMMFGPVASYTFTKDLYFGMTDADVRFLQKKLNESLATQIAAAGAGSPGNESYYFGQLTRDALIRFQRLHDITPAAGYCGPKTRAFLNQ